MNAAEIAQLLGIASTLDNRISAGSKLQVRSWSRLLDDVPYTVAERALREHYRRSTETLMPANIVEHWHITRREAAEHRQRAELTALPHRPDETAVRAGIARVTAALAAVRGIDPEYAEADAAARRAYLAIACPYCRAQPGNQCTGPGRRPLTKTPAHPARLDAALITNQA